MPGRAKLRAARPICRAGGILLALMAVPAPAQENTRYRYDELGRLIEVEERRVGGNGALGNYEYDPGSNRTRVMSSGQFRARTLAPNTTLAPGETVLSQDARFRFVFQFDSNLVLYDQNNVAIWASHTQWGGGKRLVMQEDGNLVMYTDTQPIWSTGTWTYPGSRLDVQNDGNVVIYDRDNVPRWASGTCCR